MSLQQNKDLAKDSKLKTRDLINVGIFTAIYFVVFFVTGMLGYIPVLMLVIPFLCPFVAGIPFMLFLTRVEKFGMITIMGAILSALMLFTGHPWVVVPLGICIAFISDLIFRMGNYRKWKHILIGYVVFSQWLIGLMAPLFFMRETYFATIRAGYGDTYADTLLAITPLWVFFLMFLFIALGGFFGAYLGRSVLKKHFRKAGIV